MSRYLFGNGKPGRDSWIGAGIGTAVAGLAPVAVKALSGPPEELNAENAPAVEASGTGDSAVAAAAQGSLAAWVAKNKLRAHMLKWADVYGLVAGVVTGGVLAAVSPKTRGLGYSTMLFAAASGAPGVAAQFALPRRTLRNPVFPEGQNVMPDPAATTAAGGFLRGNLGVYTIEKLTGMPVRVKGRGSRQSFGVYTLEQNRRNQIGGYSPVQQSAVPRRRAFSASGGGRAPMHYGTNPIQIAYGR